LFGGKKAPAAFVVRFTPTPTRPFFCRGFASAAQPAPALVTLFFGANDSALPERESGFQHVPVAEYKENLRTIIRHIQANSVQTRLLLVREGGARGKGMERREAPSLFTYRPTAAIR